MKHDYALVASLPFLLATAAAVAATGNGTGIDISGLDGQAAVILDSAAASAGTNPTLDVKLQESDTVGSGYTDIPGAAFSEVTNAASLQKIVINTDERKKYIRAVDTIGGTSSPSFVRSVVLLGLKKL